MKNKKPYSVLISIYMSMKNLPVLDIVSGETLIIDTFTNMAKRYSKRKYGLKVMIRQIIVNNKIVNEWFFINRG